MITRYKVVDIKKSDCSEYSIEFYDKNGQQLFIFQEHISSTSMITRKNVPYIDIVINYNNLLFDEIFSSISFVNSILFFKFVDNHFPETRTCKWFRLESDKINVQLSVIKNDPENEKLYISYKNL